MRRTTPVLAGVIACALLAAAGTAPAPAATSDTTVSASVPSASSLSTTGCASGTANVTDMGYLAPATAYVTTADCSLTWGSSNDTAMLRMYQEDGRGNGMWQPSVGTPDATFSGDGLASMATATGVADNAGALAVQPDGKVIIAVGSASPDDMHFTRFNVDCSLDTTFAGDGTAMIDLATVERVFDIALQPDGSLVALGYTGTTVWPDTTTWDTVVVRLTASGVLDTSFSGDGVAPVPLDGGRMDVGDALAIQPDGRIVTTSRVHNGVDFDAAFQRLMPDGGLDATFDGDGRRIFAIGTGDDSISSTALQSDGSILACATLTGGTADMAAVRLTADGAHDLSFDGDGVATVDFGGTDACEALALDAIGRPVLAGWSSAGGTDDVALARLTDTGALDTGFDGDGRVTTAVGIAADRAHALRVQADGRIVIAGYRGDTANDSLLVRYLPTGALDGTFDGDGIVVTAASTESDEAYDLELGADGELLAYAAPVIAGVRHMGVLRYGGIPVPDYAVTTADWGSAAGAFGACLREVSGTGVTGTWAVNATCPATSGAYWNAIPATGGAASSKVAASTTPGTVTATAAIRFGFQTGSSQATGSYVAPVVFSVIAPNA